MKATLRILQCAAVISLLVLGTTSCDSGPKYGESEEIKSFILWNCVGSDYVESLCNLWIEEVNNGNIEVEHYEIPEYTDSDVLTLSQECFCAFRQSMKIVSDNQHSQYEVLQHDFDFEKDFDYYMERFEYYCKYGISDYTNDQIKQDQETAYLIGSALYHSFYDYFKKFAGERVKLLSWEFDVMNTGDLFTGYTLTYEVDSNFYALATLLEYDSGEKYEISIVNKGDSLIELNQ